MALSLLATLLSYLSVRPIPTRVATLPTQQHVTMSASDNKLGAASLAAAAVVLAGAQSASAGPFTRSEIASLTYEQIKGTGLANTCPKVEGGGSTSIKLGGKNYKIDEFCLEPTSFQVLEEKLTKNGVVTEAVDTKVTTRQTYVLTGINGDLTQKDGKLTFIEKDGIDYAPTTVQLPGGERVPFLYTVKSLVAQSEGGASSIDPGLKLSGTFTVPSYRTGLFLDPKGRGMVTGYDQAVALPALQAGDDSSLFKENNKKFDVGTGSIELKVIAHHPRPNDARWSERAHPTHHNPPLQVTDVNAESGEFGGVFVQKQPSDTDLGSKAPKEVLLKGAFFGAVY